MAYLDPQPSLALGAVQRVIAPLARLLMAHGVTFTEFVDAAKRAFIAAAERDAGGPLNDSRLHAITGIHRRDLQRLRVEPPDEQASVSSVPFLVWDRWGKERPYLDEQGDSLVLPRTAPEGQPSFDSLVRSVTRHVRPRAVLDMLVQQNRAQVGQADRVERLGDVTAVNASSGVTFESFARNGHDRLAATVENMLAGRGVHVIRALGSDAINIDDFEALKLNVALAFDPLMSRFMREVADATERARVAPAACRRVTLSVLMYSEPTGSPAAGSIETAAAPSPPPAGQESQDAAEPSRRQTTARKRGPR